MKLKHKNVATLAATLITFGSLAGGANAALIGISSAGNASERAELISTLSSLGHTTTSTIDGSLDLILSFPSGGISSFGGVPYLQISDHGSGLISNTTTYIGTSSPNVTISLTEAHPIFTGVSSSWVSKGFWNYGLASSWVGSATAGTALADANVDGSGAVSNVLAVDGSNNIYIGWNVYGSDATSDDIQLLSNAIEFQATGSVAPEPSSALLLGFSALGFVSRRKRTT